MKAKVVAVAALAALAVVLALGQLTNIKAEEANSLERVEAETAENLLAMCRCLYNRIEGLTSLNNITLPEGLDEKMANASTMIDELEELVSSGMYDAAIAKSIEVMRILNPVLNYVLAKVKADEGMAERLRVMEEARLRIRIMERVERMLNSTEALNVSIPVQVKVKISNIKALIRNSNATHILDDVKEAIEEALASISARLNEIVEAKVVVVVVPGCLKGPSKWIEGSEPASWLLEKHGVENAIAKLNASVERLKEVKGLLEAKCNSTEALEAIDRAIKVHERTIERLESVKDLSGEKLADKLREIISEHIDEGSKVASWAAENRARKRGTGGPGEAETSLNATREMVGEAIQEQERTQQQQRVERPKH
ncbi:MAG: hypothetical protein QFX33_00515 [Candidatus Nezhaarchaeota archaeon]|nr:hypothetical protein [Candidatus Nezhaarchaeota archaeon]